MIYILKRWPFLESTPVSTTVHGAGLQIWRGVNTTKIDAKVALDKGNEAMLPFTFHFLVRGIPMGPGKAPSWLFKTPYNFVCSASVFCKCSQRIDSYDKEAKIDIHWPNVTALYFQGNFSPSIQSFYPRF